MQKAWKNTCLRLRYKWTQEDSRQRTEDIMANSACFELSQSSRHSSECKIAFLQQLR